jgi:hypothetical protein
MINKQLSFMACVAGLALMAATADAQQRGGRGPVPAPARGADEGQGPYERLILRGGIVIDGTGAPPRGPMDIVIEGNRITAVRGSGGGGRGRRGGARGSRGGRGGEQGGERGENQAGERAGERGARGEQGGERGEGGEQGERGERGEGNQPEPTVIDIRGKYVMPGFINLHAHAGEGKAPQTEYVYKLYLAHGVTTLRGVSFGPEEFGLSERERSARNEIVAPRIVVYQRPPGWDLKTADEARAWVRGAAGRGVEGLKLDAYPPEIMAALIDEAHKSRMGTVAHLSQMGVAQMNALDAARVGLDCVTHFYGIFEALYKDHDVQPWPEEMNYNNEQYRFGQVARQWDKIHPPGSDEWKALLVEFKERGTILDATMVAYLASRDLMRARSADWHEKYTLPSLWNFYTPNRSNHGSYFYDWTTADEVAWRNFYRVWMEFIDDYNDIGGRVTVSDDAAFIYNLWGFGIIQEMELFQEAGFHPLEVIRSATMYPAQAIFEPKRMPIEYGVVRPGMLADLAIVGENPLHNLKVLYGTGTPKLNDETGKVERIGGIELVVKDGIVYDAKKLLADVAQMVQDQKDGMKEGAENGGEE